MENDTKRTGIFTQENILKVLDACYQQSIKGIQHISPPIEQFANEYLRRYKNETIAAKAMIAKQVIKCTTSGFITGFGGLITLPISIPANIGSVLYVQMRMIACAAHLAGLDTTSDQVQTLVYACLAGVSVNSVVKNFGIKFGQKVANNLIKKIPGSALTKINQKIGFRLFTKFGQKGLINLGKMIPAVGAVINGGFDLVETKAIGNRAYKMFFESDFVSDTDSSVEDIIIDDSNAEE